MNKKHECVLLAAANAVADRGHTGDLRLADSIRGIIASIKSKEASVLTPESIKAAWKVYCKDAKEPPPEDAFLFAAGFIAAANIFIDSK